MNDGSAGSCWKLLERVTMNFLPGASARGPGCDLRAGELWGGLGVKASQPQLQREGAGPGWVSTPKPRTQRGGRAGLGGAHQPLGVSLGVLSRSGPLAAVTLDHVLAPVALGCLPGHAPVAPSCHPQAPLPGPGPCPQYPRLPTGSMDPRSRPLWASGSFVEKWGQ